MLRLLRTKTGLNTLHMHHCIVSIITKKISQHERLLIHIILGQCYLVCEYACVQLNEVRYRADRRTYDICTARPTRVVVGLALNTVM